MTDEQKTAYALFIILAIYSIVSFIYSDQISNWALQADALSIWIVYYFSSPIVVIGILAGYYVGKRKNKGLQGIAAGTAMIFALDLISLPKSLIVACPFQIPTISQLALFSDTALAKALLPSVNSNVCVGGVSLMTAFIYVVIPILLFIFSLKILGYRLWSKELNGKI